MFVSFYENNENRIRDLVGDERTMPKTASKIDLSINKACFYLCQNLVLSSVLFMTKRFGGVDRHSRM